MIKTINKSFQYRIYPTLNQEKVLSSWFGQTRFIYNYFLRQRIDYYIFNKGKKKQSLNYHDTAKMLTKLKQQPEFTWLNESNSQSLQQSLRHLDNAYSHFFKDGFRFPNFKKKNRKQSLTIPQSFSLNLKTKRLTIPKLTPIKIIINHPTEGQIKNITISQKPSGKYFASFLCEIKQEVKPKKEGKEIGIDLGLKSFLVTSNNEKVSPPQFLIKSEKKLKQLQRQLSRKVKRSNRSDKAQIKVARMYEKISNQRKDFLHKLSHKLVSENQTIYVEDLNVKGLMANHHLAKSISDSSWREFIRQIKYKSEWNGVYFSQIDRFFPSSKRCNSCGWINDSLTLKDREWTCQSCGQIIDRDLNAAKNILQFGKVNKVGQELSEPPKRSGRGGAVMPLIELRS